jgi:3-methyl-2-oxobutanoate hydroxymethyltransferase
MTTSSRSKFTVPHLATRKQAGEPITMVTAYDATSARIVDAAGVDVILVGDSVGTVVQGHHNTLSVTMDQMAYHVQMVASQKTTALVVGDLPFGSYHTCHRDAIENAVRLIQHGAEVVKLEGGIHLADTIAAMCEMDIAVMGHIGLTPQSYHRMGGHKVQGRSSGDVPGSRQRLIEDALAVESAGACAVVIEGVPMDVAEEITSKVTIPTIGIGAGPHCDGQVLVFHDVVGLSEREFTFTKAYAQLRTVAIDAISQFVDDVQKRTWPDDSHSFH